MLQRRFSGRWVLVAFLLGLLIATAGTATAAKLITGKQIKNGSIGLADLNPQARRSLQGKQGPAGPAGAEGRPGAAKAYGHVGPTGILDSSSGMGGATVRHDESATAGGVYCFSGLLFTPQSAIVTVDAYGQSADVSALTVIGGDNANCPGAQVAVLTAVGGVVKDHGFYFLLN